MTEYSLSQFEYEKNRKILIATLSALGLTNFPRELSVKSDATGHVVKFLYDNEAAESNEFWDGEMAEYKPNPPISRVVKLVLHHGM